MAPQTKGIYVQAAATLLLLVVTILYAISTNNMANTAKKQFDLAYGQHQANNRPYVYFDKFELQPEKFEGLQYMIIMKNSGLIPAKVKFEKYCINKEDNCIKHDDYAYIFPNSDGTNFGEIGSTTEFKKSIEDNGEFKLMIKLKYWAINDRETKTPYLFESTIKIFKDPNMPSNFLHENLVVNAN